MASYKPGQVSALLFASTKKLGPQDDNLTKLFSLTNSSAQVMRPTVVLRKQNSPVMNSINGSSSRPKLKKKKTKKMQVNCQQNQMPEENLEKAATISTPFPYIHETLQQKFTWAAMQPVKPRNRVLPQFYLDVSQLVDCRPHPADIAKPDRPLKRKLEKGKKEDNESMGKRPRRDRNRDKDADKKTIFVGNCPLTTDKKKLKKLFREFGEIETIRFRCAPSADPTLPKRAIVITKNFHEQCNNFVSYVVFKDKEAANNSLVRNGYLLDGLHLRVDLATLAKKHDKKRSIFVGNLPFTINEEVIRDHFSDCGEITNVRIVRDRTTNLGKGICYVQFESKDSVGLALKLNKTEVQGREARVMVCSSKVKQKKDPAGKQLRTSDKSGKAKAKKIAFAPSNVTSSKFQTILKTKKEKRFRKIKKKKDSANKQDGLSSIFGDVPAASKAIRFRKGKKKDQIGKHKSSATTMKPHHKGGSFKGKESSFKGKGKGGSFKGKESSFKGKGKGNSFKGKGKGSSLKGKGQGSSFKGKGKGSSFKGSGKGKTNRKQ